MSRLQLNEVLAALDANDYSYYSRLSDEDKKQIQPWVLARYMSTNTPSAIRDVNVYANPMTTSKHPELNWMVLATCGTGKKTYHQWIAPPKNKTGNKLTQEILNCDPTLKLDDVEVICRSWPIQKIIDMLVDNGVDLKDAKGLVKDV